LLDAAKRGPLEFAPGERPGEVRQCRSNAECLVAVGRTIKDCSVLRSLSLFTLLMVFWFALSGRYHLWDPEHAKDDAFFTGCGVASCLFVTWLASRRMKIVDEEGHPVHLAWRGVSYALWLAWQIVLSNWDVFKRVWSPVLPIAPCIVKVPYATRTDFGTALYANSITLTPGTVTIDIDPEKRELTIHCLTRGVADDLQAGGMQERVKRFEDGK
jgi:multicomponent Na+:H+ antiporter subunit E